MNIFNQVVESLPSYRGVKSALDSRVKTISIEGLAQIHKANYLLGLADSDRVSLVVTDSEIHAKKLCEDINRLNGSEIACLLPSKEFCFIDTESVSREYEHARIGTLTKSIEHQCRYIVGGIESMLQKTIPKEILCQKTLKLSSGDEVVTSHLAMILIENGYSRTEKIEGYAQFSIRGDIIDIFPPNEDNPIRIELWGDEVDSISYFDLDSQRRIDTLESVTIPPAKESVFTKDMLLDRLKKLADSNSGKFQENVIKDIQRLNSNLTDIPTIDRYFSTLYGGLNDTIFSYIDGFICLCEYDDCKHYSTNLWIQIAEDMRQSISDGFMVKELCNYVLEFPQFLSYVEKFQTLHMTKYNQTNHNDIRFDKVIKAKAVQTSLWSGDMNELIENLNELIKQDFSIILMAGNDKTSPIIAQDLQNKGIPCDLYSEGHNLNVGRVLLLSGSVSAGFEYNETKICLISQNRASAFESSKVRTRKKKKKAQEEIKALSDIAIGDLVVHENYGIGKFIGVKQDSFDGVVNDYITIQYAGTDVLSIPITQLDMVSRYMGGKDGQEVKLNKLSTNDWQRTKNRVKKSVKDMAEELIKLYAKREQSQGFAFSPDSDMQIDFEKRFPYVETDDQLQSVAEIKADMEKDRPMDRLLCGDVGFGKTEVALRAIFKCIYDGKQAVILAPTTVLAYQHFQTCLKRFEGFPIKIQLLSRFRTSKQQEDIIKKLKRGEIDLIIGTHRLVQKDVHFKDLGLVVIDEEQRFGVAHKEKFKKAFTGVDVLTLSATPIPRTLNMAMTGIRDMSVIEEAPQDRHPVQTYVIERNMGVIAQALTKELKRGGQAYFVHNRIDTIDYVTAELREFLPEAKIVFAHGQMSHEQISDIWEQLIDGEIDILVSTTIIETGIDVPNVNTIVIDNADCFGLSQLYQLKGRVGRSNKRAYAYMMYAPNKNISADSQKRLDAIKEFTQFGSGFKIAMRDLEIRGAGSILGGSQHGHMESVGYELYIKLLSQAIAEERGEIPIKKVNDCSMDIHVDAYIPTEYITSVTQRLDIYKRITTISTPEQKTDMVDELVDRYGNPDKVVTNLIDVSYLRNRASTIGVHSITLHDNWINLYSNFLDDTTVNNLNKNFKGRLCSNLNGTKKFITVKLCKNEKPITLIENVLNSF